MFGSNEYKYIYKTLSNEGGHIKVNRILVAKLGIELALIYSELLSLQIEAMKNMEYQIIDDLPYFVITIEKLNNNFGLSAHKQRSIINSLQDKGLLNVYYTSSNVRMVHIVDDYEIISEILSPKDDMYSYIHRNISAGFNGLKDLLLKNIKLMHQKNIYDFDDEFEMYLKEQISTFNDEFETYLKKQSSNKGGYRRIEHNNDYEKMVV